MVGVPLAMEGGMVVELPGRIDPNRAPAVTADGRSEARFTGAGEHFSERAGAEGVVTGGAGTVEARFAVVAHLSPRRAAARPGA